MPTREGICVVLSVSTLLASGAAFFAAREMREIPTSAPTIRSRWREQPATERREKVATFSIVAADPKSGICGMAVASKYRGVGRVVGYVRGGVGAFCTQHWLKREFGERALDLLEAGKAPAGVIDELLKDDNDPDGRQLAIIDIRGRAVNHHPVNAGTASIYWGGMTGRFYACQGNTLTGPEVIVAMARAYEESKGSLADRLMSALIAGDCAGGDHRGRLGAGIRVAKPGVEGYWLELQVDESKDAVVDLARQYNALKHNAKGDWSGGKPPFKPPCPNRPEPKSPTVRLMNNSG